MLHLLGLAGVEFEFRSDSGGGFAVVLSSTLFVLSVSVLSLLKGLVIFFDDFVTFPVFVPRLTFLIDLSSEMFSGLSMSILISSSFCVVSFVNVGFKSGVF